MDGHRKGNVFNFGYEGRRSSEGQGHQYHRARHQMMMVFVKMNVLLIKISPRGLCLTIKMYFFYLIYDQ